MDNLADWERSFSSVDRWLNFQTDPKSSKRSSNKENLILLVLLIIFPFCFLPLFSNSLGLKHQNERHNTQLNLHNIFSSIPFFHLLFLFFLPLHFHLIWAGKRTNFPPRGISQGRRKKLFIAPTFFLPFLLFYFSFKLFVCKVAWFFSYSCIKKSFSSFSSCCSILLSIFSKVLA